MTNEQRDAIQNAIDFTAECTCPYGDDFDCWYRLSDEQQIASIFYQVEHTGVSRGEVEEVMREEGLLQ